MRSLLHRRLIVELGRSSAPGPAVPVRDRLRLPRAVRADEPRGAAAARRRGRRPARRGGRRDARRRSATPAAATTPATRRRAMHRTSRPTDARRAAPEGPGRRRGRLAPGERDADRRRPRDGRREGRHARRRRSIRDRAVIAVDGRVIGGASAHAYLLLHKPAGVTSTTRDRHAERTVLDLLPTALVPEGSRLYPVGRLDQDSEGMLLLTNDGAWSERVLHPRFGVEREYAVATRAPLDAPQVDALRAGHRARGGPGAS